MKRERGKLKTKEEGMNANLGLRKENGWTDARRGVEMTVLASLHQHTASYEQAADQFRYYHVSLTGSVLTDSGGGEGGEGGRREREPERWGDWEVIIGDMLTWRGACNPQQGTQTNTGTHTHTHLPAMLYFRTSLTSCEPPPPTITNTHTHKHTHSQVDWH